jgi:ABC-type lipoprotein release transport system permease subunit
MTLKSLAFKNIRHHRSSYSAYFLSCIFAVLVFFLYASLLFHPILKNELFPDQFILFLYLVEAIVALFAFLFIGYSQSAFLRNRKQDIGLLQILGMPVRQVVRMIFWENILVGALAVLIGIFTGTIGSKFFFLAVSYVLQLPDPIPVNLSFGSIILTISFFFCLFLILSWISRFSLQKQSISQVLRERVQEKKKPKFSIWFVLLSLVSIAIAYWFSFTTSFAGITKNMIFILAFLFIGTYFGYTQLSIAVIALLEKLPKWFYRGTNLFLFSQLRFRLRDNARILFLVTIFTSIVLTAVGVCFTYYMESDTVGEEQAPYHVSVVASPLNKAQMEKKIQSLGLKRTAHIQFQILQLKTTDRNKNMNNPVVYAISNTALNQLLQQEKRQKIMIHADEVIQVRNSGIWNKAQQKQEVQSFTVQQQQESYQWKWEKIMQGVLFNEHDQTRIMWAVSDGTFAKLQKRGAEVIPVEGYRFSDPSKGKALLEDMKKQFQSHNMDEKNSTGTIFLQAFFRDLFSPLLFVSVFIGLLFFLAAGSILFFRLSIELPSERLQLELLNKLGLREEEANKILVRQIKLLFAIPFLVGSIHSFAGLTLFSFLLHRPVFASYLWVWFIYLVLGMLYYFWTKRSMLHAIGRFQS